MTYYRAIFTICLAAAILTVGLFAGCKKQPRQAAASDSNQAAQQQPVEPIAAAKPTAPQIIAQPKLTLNQIIKSSTSWEPSYTRWYGKEAPDFTVTDLNGQTHAISKYKGKNIMLVFWATWCPPCRAEIPHIIELRKEVSEDKLVILGISFVDRRNSLEAIQQLVKANPVINYPIVPTDQITMPKPYIQIDVLPTSFFIDPQGKIKLAAEGMIPLPQIKAIIEAEQ